MSLQTKTLGFVALYLIVAFCGAGAAHSFGGNDAAVLVVLLLFVAFGIAQFILLRCPHCGNVATIRPSGFVTPLVGKRCRYCGTPF